MRIFLIINLLIVIISSYGYRINNNCAWPDDCYITMKFTETCAIESATVKKAVINNLKEREIRVIDDKTYTTCFGFPKESSLRCYIRCNKGPMVTIDKIPENRVYEYTSNTFRDNLEKYKDYNDYSFRAERFGWVTVEAKDKPEESKFWKNCVFKGLTNSSSKQENSESKAPVKLDLNCVGKESFCLIRIVYTLDGIKSITSRDQNTKFSNDNFYITNVHSCRIFERTVECICKKDNRRCKSFDHLLESIYLLGRDNRMKGQYRGVRNNNGTQYDENIPKVLEMLQKIRTNYPRDIHGSTDLDCPQNDSCKGYCVIDFKIADSCDYTQTEYPKNQYSRDRSYISPHRFVDADRTGSIALEVVLKSKQLNVKVHCRMGCIDKFPLYASIMNVLSRQMETEDDIILFTSHKDVQNKEKEEYYACAYYYFRSLVLKRMYDTYDIPSEQPETIRAILKPNEILPLIISTIFASIIVVLILSIMVIGTISYFRSQTKKEQPITFSKKTVIARRKKPTGKSSEFVNSKDKSGDFYDCVSKKTSTVNNTDLASVHEETKSKD